MGPPTYSVPPSRHLPQQVQLHLTTANSPSQQEVTCNHKKSTERASKLEDTQILLSNRELFLHQNKDVYLKHYISPNQTLSHQNGADAALHTMSRDPPSPRDPSHACDIVHFSSAKDNCSSSNNEKKESDDKKPDLDSLAVELAYGITHIFLKSPNWKIYNPNLIFEDRIYSGKTHEGLLNYVKFLHLIKIVAHIKFVYVRCHVLYINKHPEDGTIGIRWKMTGLGITRLVIRYLPDKLWRRGNMDDAARVWYEGYSTFHVGDDNMIFKHVADTRMPDKFKEEMESALNPVVEKLRKLKPVVKQPVPTI